MKASLSAVENERATVLQQFSVVRSLTEYRHNYDRGLPFGFHSPSMSAMIWLLKRGTSRGPLGWRVCRKQLNSEWLISLKSRVQLAVTESLEGNECAL